MVCGLGDNCRQSDGSQQSLLSYIRRKNILFKSNTYFYISVYEMFFLILRKNAAKQQASFSTLRKRFSAMQHPHQEMALLHRKEVRRHLRASRKLLCTGISPAAPWLQMAASTRNCIHVQYLACTYFWMASMSMSPASRAFPPRLQRRLARLPHHSASPLFRLKDGRAVCASVMAPLPELHRVGEP